MKEHHLWQIWSANGWGRDIRWAIVVWLVILA